MDTAKQFLQRFRGLISTNSHVDHLPELLCPLWLVAISDRLSDLLAQHISRFGVFPEHPCQLVEELHEPFRFLRFRQFYLSLLLLFFSQRVQLLHERVSLFSELSKALLVLLRLLKKGLYHFVSPLCLSGVDVLLVYLLLEGFDLVLLVHLLFQKLLVELLFHRDDLLDQAYFAAALDIR